MSLVTPDLPSPRVIQVDTRGALILEEQSPDVSVSNYTQFPIADHSQTRDSRGIYLPNYIEPISHIAIDVSLVTFWFKSLYLMQWPRCSDWWLIGKGCLFHSFTSTTFFFFTSSKRRCESASLESPRWFRLAITCTKSYKRRINSIHPQQLKEWHPTRPRQASQSRINEAELCSELPRRLTKL
jgi:hypothetical protein